MSQEQQRGTEVDTKQEQKRTNRKKEKSGAALESGGDRLFDLSSFIIPAWGQIMQS